MNPSDLLDFLPQLPLRRLHDEENAGLWSVSLPWPASAARELYLDGRPTFNHALGQWPGAKENQPRRILLFADGQNSAPPQLSLHEASTALPGNTPPSARMEPLERSPHEEYIWEKHWLHLQSGERSIKLALGLKTGDEVHWWEACRLVVLEETPDCLTIEMGGAIAHQQMSIEEFHQYSGYTSPYLHRHNWINGHIHARLHSNGVCEVFAHHINSKFFDDGLELKDAVPVMGLQTENIESDAAQLVGDWDGSRGAMELGDVRFDVREVARLATPEQPGQMELRAGVLVWHPYLGMELFGGLCPQELTGDPYIFHAEDKTIPRGMARTLRFSLSLSDRSPRIARYQAPAWWYGVCCELSPAPLLPVSNLYDSALEECRQWARKTVQCGGFEDGALPRHAEQFIEAATKREPGWEGEVPYGLFLSVWLGGDGQDFDAALRAAYYFTDVSVDHAVKLVRMHGFRPPAFAVPMNRMQGTLAAYLETGDPYLLDAARDVTDNASQLHKNSWPRMAVGRDACFINGAMLLYRYCGDDHYHQIAHEGALAVVGAQRENGSFGDQGGGSGIHQWGGYITKPWMGLLATNGVLDYLELFPDDEVLLATVKKFADWLMSERLERDGVVGWAYQHDFNGARAYYDPYKKINHALPSPRSWHQENLGRLLTFCSLRFNDPCYADAWAQSRHEKIGGADHSVAAALQFVPWVQSHLWNATLEKDGITLRPLHFGPLTPQDATLSTPDGEKTLRWNDESKVQAPDSVRVEEVIA